MNATELIQSLTAKQIDDIVFDFKRLLAQRSRSRTGREINDCFLDDRKYWPVCQVLHKAEAANRAGDKKQKEFFRGMAAGLCGVIRLMAAKELEQILRPRLEPPDPASGRCADNTDPDTEADISDATHKFSAKDLAGYLEADGVKCLVSEEDDIITATLGLDKMVFVQLLAFVKESPRCVALVFRLPMTIPEHKRKVMAEVLSRVNYGMVLGCFEMDLSNGDLNFRLAIPTDGAGVSLSQFRYCMVVSVLTIKQLLTAFYRIVFCDADPDEVLPYRDS